VGGKGGPAERGRSGRLTQGLRRMLGHRPLLAPSGGDLAVIAVALVEFKPRVEVASDTVLRALRAQLAA